MCDEREPFGWPAENKSGAVYQKKKNDFEGKSCAYLYRVMDSKPTF